MDSCCPDRSGILQLYRTLPGVLTLVALVAAFILGVGLAQFTANKAEVLAPLQRKLLLAAACLLLILAAAAAFVKAKGKAFSGFRGVGYFAASVELTPPGTTVQIKELEELAGYLNDIVVYEKIILTMIMQTDCYLFLL